MTSEKDSMRALALEAQETVTLTQEFYQCIVKDPRTKSGDKFLAVKLPPAAPIPRVDVDSDAPPPVAAIAQVSTVTPKHPLKVPTPFKVKR